jgi:hypothetical protein
MIVGIAGALLAARRQTTHPSDLAYVGSVVWIP